MPKVRDLKSVHNYVCVAISTANRFEREVDRLQETLKREVDETCLNMRQEITAVRKKMEWLQERIARDINQRV